MKLSEWASRLARGILAGFALCLLLHLGAIAAEFQYFGKGIDFWNEATPKQVDAPAKAKVVPPSNPLSSDPGTNASAKESFSWDRYLDPKNKEFFREGEYTPPEPFMEIVRNPSDQNLKLWFSYMEKKNALASRLQERLREFAIKNQTKLEPVAFQDLQSKATSMPKSSPDVTRFRFRMYFDSKCPHCKRMFETLKELQQMGYFVEARQIDSGNFDTSGIPFPIEPAAAQEVSAKDIASVPLVLVGDLTRKVVYRITGYQPTSTVLSILSQEASKS